jgi:hypothetical protein
MQTKRRDWQGEAVSSAIKEDPNGWIPGTAEAKYPNNLATLSTWNKPVTQFGARY